MVAKATAARPVRGRSGFVTAAESTPEKWTVGQTLGEPPLFQTDPHSHRTTESGGKCLFGRLVLPGVGLAIGAGAGGALVAFHHVERRACLDQRASRAIFDGGRFARDGGRSTGTRLCFCDALFGADLECGQLGEIARRSAATELVCLGVAGRALAVAGAGGALSGSDRGRPSGIRLLHRGTERSRGLVDGLRPNDTHHLERRLALAHPWNREVDGGEGKGRGAFRLRPPLGFGIRGRPCPVPTAGRVTAQG